jgi:hypothetical protein
MYATGPYMSAVTGGYRHAQGKQSDAELTLHYLAVLCKQSDAELNLYYLAARCKQSDAELIFFYLAVRCGGSPRRWNSLTRRRRAAGWWAGAYTRPLFSST